MADIEAVSGDTNVYNITVIRQNARVNLTGAKVWFTAKDDKSDTDANAIIKINSTDNGDQISILSAVNGVVQVVLKPTDTDAFVIDRAFYYDVQLKEASGLVTTIAKGVLKIRQDVTDSVA